MEKNVEYTLKNWSNLRERKKEQEKGGKRGKENLKKKKKKEIWIEKRLGQETDECHQAIIYWRHFTTNRLYIW